MAARVIKLIVITDIICPFSYIAHKELRDAILQCPSLPVKFDIQYRPYMLIADIGEDESVDKETYYRSKMKENYETRSKAVQEAAERVGLNISLTGGVIAPTTRAHRLLQKAYQLGGQQLQFPLLSNIFKAFCTEQKNIGDIKVLAEIAQSSGVMSEAEAITFLNSNAFTKEVETMAADARLVGVKGVPLTLIDGRWAMSGTQPAEKYVQIFQKLAFASANASPTPASPPVPELVTV